ncbi:partitioning defective 3 homolog isoform X2 [Liolophura sinensis]|uniref:partitioning defective 3 homolog isoform X2 n=1 Tax=Liolophura sinensis TaxID=3198878 RepID=UPI003159401F
MMKVTVCFGSTRVIVPCGDGNLPVRDLVEKAITRYKKATGKPTEYWVTVHNVKTSEDGGILDPDDQVCAVADDREQIIAYFEEQSGPPVPHNGGDGASASSVGTSSPDIFTGGEITVIHSDVNDVVVTPGDLSTGSALTVRRGSEPALNNIGQDEPLPDYSDTATFPRKAKRWSAIVTPSSGVQFTSTPKRENESSADNSTRKIPLRVRGNGEEKNLFNRFARDSWRQSLSNQPNMFKWLEAQGRQEDKFNQGQVERSEPVGGLATSGSSESDQSQERPSLSQNGTAEDGSIYIVLPNSGGPLGIHVVPDFDENGSDMGLMIQSIEKGGRVHKDGRMKVQDRIVEINGTPLINVNFAKAQSIFKKAMQSDEIRLRVLKRDAPPLPKQPPPVLPKGRSSSRNSNLPLRPSPLTLPNTTAQEASSGRSTDSNSDSDTQRTSSSAETVNERTPANSGTDNTVYSSDGNSQSKPRVPAPRHSGKSAQSVSFNTNSNGKMSQQSRATMPIKPGPPIKAGGGGPVVNGTRKTPPVPPVRHPSTSLSPSSSLTSTSSSHERVLTAPTNTRRIGKKINIQLVKGPLGLGFSVTTRDNPAGGNCPIYIKNILPKGAAIIDGRLKSGDRLLEVNGEPMTGKTQAEAVNILRNTKLGSSVHIVVSRQTDTADDMFKVPRELNDQNTCVNLQPPDKVNNNDDTVPTPRNRQLLELDIPLNDTGSAGLGVSVKGKTQNLNGNVSDLGIFIKAVIHGGAASKDGRLMINDQLLEVNAKSLVGLSNTDAMETLRKAMQSEGITPGFINIKVARKIGAPSPSPFGEEERELKIRSVSETSESSNVSRVEMEAGHDESSDSFEVSSLNDSQNHSSLHYNNKAHQDLNSSQNVYINNNNKPLNPMLDRLRNNGGNRNESYNRAVHESMNDSSLSKISSLDGSMYGEQRPRLPRSNKLTSPTVNSVSRETVIIEQDDPYAQVQKFPQGSKLRPHSTIGIMRTNSYSSSSQSNEDGPEGRAPSPPEWLMEWDRRRSQAKEDPLSPGVDPMRAFQREGFGRQSMSEKRKVKASIDPRGSEYYQRAKQAQMNHHRGTTLPSPGPLTRAGSAESLLGRTNTSSVHEDTTYNPAVMGPTLGMKKSSSLESLETAMQDVGMDNDDDLWGRGRHMRNRGCNESFRAAVDRSYDPTKLNIQMDIVEEDSSENGSLHPGRRTGSSRSSVSSETQDDTLKRKKKDKEKKGGIFKGIFKFGRNRKSVENLRASPFENNRPPSTTDHEWPKQTADSRERNPAARPSHQEQARLEDHYRKLQDKQRHNGA